MFDTPGRARRQAKRNPWKGNAFIVALTFPFGTFQVEETLGSHHFTVWGDPHDMLEYVIHVEHV